MIDTDPRHANDSSEQATSTHQDFRWTEGSVRETLYARFLEIVLDVSTGTNTCLQIAYASTLERAANADADDGQAVAPDVSIVEADHLMRLSIAATGLLRDETRRRIASLNALEEADRVR